MATARVKIDWNSVNSSFRRLGRRARKQAQEAIAHEAKRRAPVDTGALRRSIRAVGENLVVADVDYAWYQEFGTRHHPPQPYLGPALLAVAAQVRDRSWWRRIWDRVW